MKRHAFPFAVLGFIVLAVIGVPGCRERHYEGGGSLISASPPEGYATRAKVAQAPAMPAPEEPKSAQVSPRLQVTASEARKLIRTGKVSVEVKDFRAAARQAAAIAGRFGGYVSESGATKDEAGKYTGELTIRVVAEHFDEAFSQLGALGKVESENVSTEDVTKAYYDLEGRIRVARDSEARIREILRNRAAKLSEILEAEKELTRIVGEIEQMEGERRFYDRQTSLSTIRAELHEPQAITRPGSLTPLSQAIHDSVGALATSVAALIYLVMYGLPWIAIAAILWILIRRARRKKAALHTAR